MRSETHNDGLCTRKMSTPAAPPDRNRLRRKDVPFVNPASVRLSNNSYRTWLRDRGGGVRQRLAGVCKSCRRRAQLAEPELSLGSWSGPKSLPETTFLCDLRCAHSELETHTRQSVLRPSRSCTRF